jgi:hypothetical protein
MISVGKCSRMGRRARLDDGAKRMSSQRTKTRWDLMPVPANRNQIEEICRLMPERKEEVWALVYAGLTDEQARMILAEARKPRIAPTMPGAAERLHQQSGEVLAQRQEEELRQLRERRARIGHRTVNARLDSEPVESAEEQFRQRAQAVIDYWGQQRLFAQEQEERFSEDPIAKYDRDVIWRGYR